MDKTTIVFILIAFLVLFEKTGFALEWDGVLVPGKTQAIVSPARVRVEKAYFQFGERVQAGELLYDLRSQELEALCLVSKREWLENKKKLEQLQHWEASVEMKQAKANVESTYQQWQYARERFLQTQKLYQLGIIAKEEYQMDQRYQEETQKHYRQAQYWLRKCSKKAGPAERELAEMQLMQSWKKWRATEDKRAMLQPKSIFHGMLLPPKAASERGQSMIFQEEEVIAVLADLEQVHALILVDEFDVVQLRKGQSAYLQLAAFPDIQLKGQVVSVGLAQATQKNGNAHFEVRVNLLSLPEKLKENLYFGFTVKVDIMADD